MAVAKLSRCREARLPVEGEVWGEVWEEVWGEVRRSRAGARPL